MKILVTGGGGFLGSHLCRRLLKEGHDIRILKSPSQNENGDNFAEEAIKTEIVVGDIRDFKSAAGAVRGCDVVFHLAGIISYWNRLNALQYEVNVIGTRNIVNACLQEKIKRLIHTSSTAAVGVSEDKLADETTPYNLEPLGVNYCDTKHWAEVEVYEGIKKGLDAVIVCPASMYGPGDIRRIKHDALFNFKGVMGLFYVGGGIAVVDVEDAVEGEIRAWKKGRRGERYILAGENLTFYEIRKTIAEALGRKIPKIRLPHFVFLALGCVLDFLSYFTGKRPKITPAMARFNKMKFYFSNEKTKKELNMTFRPFKESIARAVKWYRQRGYL